MIKRAPIELPPEVARRFFEDRLPGRRRCRRRPLPNPVKPSG
jgi:hypothetical protein